MQLQILGSESVEPVEITTNQVLNVPTGLQFPDSSPPPATAIPARPDFVDIVSDCPFLQILSKNDNGSFDLWNPTESRVEFEWKAHHLHSDAQEPLYQKADTSSASELPPPEVLCELPGGGVGTDALDFGLWLGKTRTEVGHADNLTDTELQANVAPWRFFDVPNPGVDADISRYFAGTIIEVGDPLLSWNQKGEWPPQQFLEAPPFFDIKVGVEALSPYDQDHEYLPFVAWLYSQTNFGLLMMIEPDINTYINNIYIYRMVFGALTLMSTINFAGNNWSALTLRMKRDVVWDDTLSLYVRRWKFGYQDPLSGLWVVMHTILEDPKEILPNLDRFSSYHLHNYTAEPQLPFLLSTINIGVSASIGGFNGDGFARFYDFAFIYPELAF
jgi:hypothetical protein